MLLVLSMLIMDETRDPGTVKDVPSLALNPDRASVPPSPLNPPDLSPVVHCISPSAYRNITKDPTLLVARTHWNVFTYIGLQKKKHKMYKLFIYFDTLHTLHCIVVSILHLTR